MSEDATKIRFSPAVPEDLQDDQEGRMNSDWFMDLAKKLVVSNYNAHHDAEVTPELETNQVYTLWCTKILSSWKACVSSTTVRGMIWIVTLNGPRDEAYVEIYRRINNVKIERVRRK